VIHVFPFGLMLFKYWTKRVKTNLKAFHGYHSMKVKIKYSDRPKMSLL